MGRPIPDAGFESSPFGADPWRLTAEGAAIALPRSAAVFALGNGFVGVCAPGDKAANRVFLNGVFEKVAIPYHEAAFGYARESDMRLPVADGAPAVTIDGVLLGAPVRLELDVRTGRRIEHFVVRGVPVLIERIVSMRRQAIVACRIVVPSSEAHRLGVEPVVGNPGTAAAFEGESVDDYDPRASPALTASPWREQHSVATGVQAARVDSLAGSGFAVAAACAVSPLTDGAVAHVEAFAAYVAARDRDPLPEALAALEDARSTGFETLAAEQEAWFTDFWGTSMTACPDVPRAEQALHHAQFQLVQAVGRDGATSLAAKGQTGDGYEGHVFWDADLYALPVFAFTRPEIARAMLVWRIAGLEAARGNARAMGQMRGALYPWRTIAGSECSSFFPAGSAQYHINADAAFALRTYIGATGDETILDEGGAEMLVETARIWLEIGYHDPARDHAFVIDRVTGPDEYSALVDNNLYTNMMAAEHLRDAARIGRAHGLIDAGEAARMERAAVAMFLPFDETRRIYAQDDAFFAKQVWPFADTPGSDYPLLLHHHPLKIYRHQVAKQADAVLAIALLRDRFDPAMRVRMLDAYEAVTVHDSTLSASMFAIAAAHVGAADRAWRYWRASVLTDLCDLFGNVGHGLHMASLAGSWTAMAMGFAGMRVQDDVLSFDPIAVPDLGRYAFRVCFRGSLVEVSVDLVNASYQSIDGPAITIRHHGADAALGPDAITLPLAS